MGGEQSEYRQCDNDDYTVSNVTGNQTGDGAGCMLKLRDRVFQTDTEGLDVQKPAWGLESKFRITVMAREKKMMTRNFAWLPVNRQDGGRHS